MASVAIATQPRLTTGKKLISSLKYNEVKVFF
jgi:hypothetical protein